MYGVARTAYIQGSSTTRIFKTGRESSQRDDGVRRAPTQAMPLDSAKDIRDRSFAFGSDIVRFAMALPLRPGVRVLADQLVGSGSGVGANLEEAQGASTRREFLRGIEISGREAREALYWLRMVGSAGLGEAPGNRRLTDRR